MRWNGAGANRSSMVTRSRPSVAASTHRVWPASRSKPGRNAALYWKPSRIWAPRTRLRSSLRAVCTFSLMLLMSTVPVLAAAGKIGSARPVPAPRDQDRLLVSTTHAWQATPVASLLHRRPARLLAPAGEQLISGTKLAGGPPHARRVQGPH